MKGKKKIIGELSFPQVSKSTEKGLFLLKLCIKCPHPTPPDLWVLWFCYTWGVTQLISARGKGASPLWVTVTHSLPITLMEIASAPAFTLLSSLDTAQGSPSALPQEGHCHCGSPWALPALAWEGQSLEENLFQFSFSNKKLIKRWFTYDTCVYFSVVLKLEK